MSTGVGYQLIAGPDFDLDFRRIDAAARKNPGGPEAALRREVLRTMIDLANGKTDGHHALTYAPGKGDLRDCVTAYLRSDPQRPADYRLVFREIGPAAPNEPACRELLAIKPRRGLNNIYAQVCARLHRHPNDRQPGLNRYDDWTQPGVGTTNRQAELDAKRAIAHAWDGQRPLRSSRPLAVGGSPRAPAAPPQPSLSTTVESRTQVDDRAGMRRGRPGPTGWPERGR